jgi:pimeloyl-ACP methyl ester carboxylesterase
MDFDPGVILARVSCPVLAFYGETDEWMPVDDSVAAWRSAQARGALIDLRIVRLPGADHLPTRGGEPSLAAISTRYAETLARWVRSVCGG